MNNYEELLINVYDKAVPKNLDSRSYFTKRMVDLLDMVDLKSVTRMLDLGCGTSWAGILAAGRNLQLEVTGIDISPERIRVSKQNIRDNNLMHRIELINHDALTYPFDSSSYDLVFASSSIILFPDVKKVLDFVHKILIDGGQFAFSSYSKNSFFNKYITEAVWQVLQIELPDVKDNLNSESNIVCSCKKSGFNIVEINEVSYERFVLVKDINWNGTWIHHTNPLRDITKEQKSELIETFNRLILADSSNGFLEEERTNFYTIAIK